MPCPSPFLGACLRNRVRGDGGLTAHDDTTIGAPGAEHDETAGLTPPRRSAAEPGDRLPAGGQLVGVPGALVVGEQHIAPVHPGQAEQFVVLLAESTE